MEGTGGGADEQPHELDAAPHGSMQQQQADDSPTASDGADGQQSAEEDEAGAVEQQAVPGEAKKAAGSGGGIEAEVAATLSGMTGGAPGVLCRREAVPHTLWSMRCSAWCVALLSSLLALCPDAPYQAYCGTRHSKPPAVPSPTPPPTAMHTHAYPTTTTTTRYRAPVQMASALLGQQQQQPARAAGAAGAASRRRPRPPGCRRRSTRRRQPWTASRGCLCCPTWCATRSSSESCPWSATSSAAASTSPPKQTISESEPPLSVRASVHPFVQPLFCQRCGITHACPV